MNSSEYWNSPTWCRWASYYDPSDGAYYISASVSDVPAGAKEIDWFYSGSKKEALEKHEPIVEKHRNKVKEARAEPKEPKDAD